MTDIESARIETAITDIDLYFSTFSVMPCRAS